MKKIYAKRPRKYNPVRICNPQKSHTVRLYPRQGIKLVLDSACSGLKLTNCPYLFFEEMEINKKNQVIYNIAQKYDLSNWAEISECFLGEIYIKNDSEDEPTIISVYHCSNNLNQHCQVLTTVNPNNCTIKLEPHRVLEVVCYEPHWEESFCNEEWVAKIEDIEVDKQGIFLEELKCGSFTTRMQTGGNKIGEFITFPRYCPNINYVLENEERAKWAGELDCTKRPGRQMHFWFAFTKKSIQVINSLKSGNYLTTRITITGKAKDRSDRLVMTKRELTLMLAKHGKPAKLVSTEDSMINRTTALMHVSAPVGTKREYDKSRGILTNPGNTEQIDLYPGLEDCIIEIAVPKTFWPEETIDAEWKLEKESGSASEKALSIIELQKIEKFGVPFQRYRIDRVAGASVNINGFLGAVKLVYPPKNHLNVTRRISVWMNHKKQGDIYSGCRNFGVVHFKNGLGTYEHPKFAMVKIEEISVVKLEDGEKTKKLKEVYTYNPSDWEDYYYYGVPVQTKKKEESGKNTATTIMGKPPIVAHSTTETKTVTTNASNTTQTIITGDAIEPIVIQNPVHLQEITLLPEQELIIRLMSPEDTLTRQEDKEKCRNELWTVVPTSIADVRPIIVRNRTTLAGTNRFRQEIVVKADSNKLPQNKGTHCMGIIRLGCSATNRLIRIHVKKDMSPEKPYNLPQVDWIKNPLIHELDKNQYFLALNWKHNQGIILKTTDVLYVQQPEESDENWKDCEWSVRFIQHSIPQNLWDRMSKDVRDVVDRKHPWYTKDHPIFTKKTLMFRAIKECAATVLPKMLEELSRLTNIVPGHGWFPVASLLFETTQTKEQPNENGITFFNVTLRREFHIGVELNPSLSQTKSSVHEIGRTFAIYYPANEATVKCVKGDILAFHLKSKSLGGGRCRWSNVSYPAFLTEFKHEQCDDDDVFKFRVDSTGDNYIRFKCYQEIRNIKIISK